MRLLSKFRSLILAGSAIGLVAGCSEADVVSPGVGNPINPIVIPPGGGGGGALGQNNIPPGGCPTGTTQNNSVNLGDGVQRAFCVLSGTLAGSVNLPANGGLPYLISGAIFVGTDGGAAANLTIAPGAVLFGANFDDTPGSGSLDVMVVTRGSKINAVGTPNSPIIFTSQQDLQDDGQPNGTGGFGQWGGVALNGRAPINHCTINPAAAGGAIDCSKNGEGGSGPFGSNVPADDSGAMSYVRIQHAGFQFSSSNELNGIALQGVGSTSQFDHIQVHRGSDDAFEWFGGTVNATHLVATGADDDNFDWTDGWIGNLQFGIVVQDTSRGDNGIEGDNREVTFTNTPRSNPSISNITMIGRGSSSGEGVQVRAGTNGRLINGIVANWNEGLEWDNDGPGAPQPGVNAFAFNGNTTLTAASGATVFGAGANNRSNASDTLIGVFPGPNEKAPAITALNPNTTLGSFFTAANYVGAMGPTDTPTTNWTTGWTIPGSIPGVVVDCPTGTTDTNEAVPAGRTESNICRLPVTIAGTLNLTPGNLYEIDGTTFVGQDRGGDPANPLAGTQAGTLNIDAGVTLFSSGETNGFDILIVNRGSQMFANGSQFAPVVFTSREQVFSSTGSSGNWGGLYLNGRAPINHCTVNPAAVGGAVDCNKNGEAGSGVFGGATVADNSGKLNYVRIEYAGFQFSGSNEANSLNFQGVGNTTQIDFVQTMFGADDGVEFFGGSVNVKHLVLLGAEDDSFDWTDGWNGNAQFVIVQQNATFAPNDNGIEADNREVTFTNLPRSNPTLSNFTILGVGSAANSNEGIQLRAGTDGRVFNSIVSRFGEGVEVTIDGVGSPTPLVNSTVFHANTANASPAGVSAAALAGANNTTPASSTLTAAPGFTITVIPGLNEVATVTNPGNPFFGTPTYVGAVQDAADTWYAGWTRGL